MPETWGGWGAGKNRHYMKKSVAKKPASNWHKCCLSGMERNCNSKENTALHFSNQTEASSDCICYREEEETEDETHGCGFWPQLTLTAGTRCINRQTDFLKALRNSLITYQVTSSKIPQEKNPMTFCIYYFNNIIIYNVVYLIFNYY